MKVLHRFPGALAATLAWFAFHSAEAAGAPDAPNSLDFRMRAELRNEYVDYQQGGGSNMLVPRLDYAVTPAFALRVEAPIVTSGPAWSGENNQAGFGDLLLRAGYQVGRGPGYGIVVGAEALLDTASKDSLGYGKEVLAPLAYASIEVPRWRSVAFPFVQRWFTVGGDDGRPDVNYTTLKAAVLTRWAARTYTIFEPQLVVDHERADKVGMTFEAEAGKFLDRRTAFWLRPGIGLHGDDLPQVYNWNLKVGIRHTF